MRSLITNLYNTKYVSDSYMFLGPGLVDILRLIL